MFSAQGVGALLGVSGGIFVEREEGAGLQVAGQGGLMVAGGFLHPAGEQVGLAKGRRIGGRGERGLVGGREQGLEQRGSLVEAAAFDGQASPAEVGQGGGLGIGLN